MLTLNIMVRLNILCLKRDKTSVLVRQKRRIFERIRTNIQKQTKFLTIFTTYVGCVIIKVGRIYDRGNYYEKYKDIISIFNDFIRNGRRHAIFFAGCLCG